MVKRCTRDRAILRELVIAAGIFLASVVVGLVVAVLIRACFG